MRILIAGATGALGRRLLPMLVQDGHDVTGLTRTPEGRAALERMGARGVVADALDAAQVDRAVREARPEAIVNELTDLPQSLNPRRIADAYARNNRVREEGGRNLLAAARAHGVGRVVLQSAAFWYAPTSPRPATEDEPFFTHAPEPIGEAVRTMRRVEDAHRAERGLATVVLRYGMLYGPGTWYSPDGDVGRQVAKRRYPVIGRGEGTVSFVHVDDAARATVVALAAPAGAYNVVDDEPAPNGEWPRVLAEALGAKPPMRAPKALARLAAGSALVEWLTTARPASNARARRDLGWRPAEPSWRHGFARMTGAPPQASVAA